MAEQTPARRGLPDPLTLLVGLVALVIAITALVGGAGWLPPVDLRWILAGSAMTVGVVLLVGSLRRRP